MIVMKFGGTSVQDSAAIKRVTEIVSGRLDRAPVVVVSAMARVTDMLLRIARTAKERRFDEVSSLIDQLRRRHLETAHELLLFSADSPLGDSPEPLNRIILNHFSDLENLAQSVATLGELTPRSQDAIASFGEQLSSLLVMMALVERGVSARLMDARFFITTDDHFTGAIPNLVETESQARRVLLPIIEQGHVPVTQGFIGATTDGVTTTIGRGGSDYSAAIIGAALGAEAVEIWTDVDGLMTADPRIVPDARRIRVVSFAEASELSYFGAKVLHPSAMLPAVERSIPVNIYNTNNPSCEGTLIVETPKTSRNVIKSIAFKRGVTIVNVASTRMLLAYGFLRTIFEVFDRHQTSVDVVTTSEVSVSMTLDNADQLEAIKRDLSGIGAVSIERDKAIICVVGDNLKFTPGVASRLFRAIENTNVNMISQGASEINLTFVIDESDAERVVQSLHKEFFSEADPEVFA
jgi:aspartate kinase